MHDELARRRLLQAAAFTYGSGLFVFRARAGDSKAATNHEEYFTRDLGLYNNSETQRKVQVRISDKNGEAVFNRTFSLEGRADNESENSSNSRHEGRIGVSGEGRHTLRVSMNDTSKTTDVFLSDSGLNGATMASIHIWPGGELDVDYPIH